MHVTKKPIWKGYTLYDSNYLTFWKWWNYCCCSVAQLCLTLFDPMGYSTPGFPSFTVFRSFPKLMSIESVMPSSNRVLLFPSPPTSSLSQYQSFPMSLLFASGDQSSGAAASASVLPVNIQDWFLCSPRDSQESSPIPQFESINSSALGLLYSPTVETKGQCCQELKAALGWGLGDAQAEHRGVLGLWKCSAWYCNGEYITHLLKSIDYTISRVSHNVNHVLWVIMW